MFFKRTPEEGKGTHIIIFTRGRAGAYMGREMGKNGKGMGGNGKGSGLRQRQKTSGPFLKRPASF